jgi:hypothetical protein
MSTTACDGLIPALCLVHSSRIHVQDGAKRRIPETGYALFRGSAHDEREVKVKMARRTFR